MKYYFSEIRPIILRQLGKTIYYERKSNEIINYSYNNSDSKQKYYLFSFFCAKKYVITRNQCAYSISCKGIPDMEPLFFLLLNPISCGCKSVIAVLQSHDRMAELDLVEGILYCLSACTGLVNA